MKPEFEAVLETVLADGQFLDTFDGRLLNPGHAIEAAWFILHESKHRGGDPRLEKIGRTILDWSWRWGWDEEYGGLLYYRDVKNLPSAEYWHDMKFWWPHNEAIIATLLAYRITRDEKYARWHQQVHDWAYSHFPDREHGEWFGYLHRDGRLSSRLKGNMFKGPFHLPRMQWYCWKLLESMIPA
jgi:N-acylglucosamine 2-epimerase